MAIHQCYMKRGVRIPRREVFCVRTAVIGVLTVVAIAYGSAFMYGQEGIAEWSPDTLEYRSRKLARVPILGIPAFATPYETNGNPLLNYLIAQGYWKSTASSNPRWHCIFHWTSRYNGHGSLYYVMATRQRDRWIAWSKANPALAAHVWPKVLEEVRTGASSGEQLLQGAYSADSIEEFDALIERETRRN